MPLSGARALHIGVYGEIDLNVVDGSTIWATSLIEMLARQGHSVSCLSRTPIKRSLLLDHLIGRYPNVSVIEPGHPRLTSAQAIRSLVECDRRRRFDVVILRGSRVACRAAMLGAFGARLWSYVTDLPTDRLGFTARMMLEMIVRGSGVLLCQTLELRDFFESRSRKAIGKTVLLPPMIPDESLGQVRDVAVGSPLKMLYAGKFAPLWHSEESTELPGLLVQRGIDAELHVYGDKIQKTRDPAFHQRMRLALDQDRVVWHRGVPRADVLAAARQLDVGLSWRSSRMDSSLQLSTKLLEYAAAGLPAVMNPTPMHVRLFGADYPLFAITKSNVVDVLSLMVQKPELVRLCSERMLAVARDFTYKSVYSGIAARLARTSRESAGRRLRHGGRLA